MKYLGMWMATVMGMSLPAHAATISSGTGFFVTHSGYLLTNAHVLAHCISDVHVSGAVAVSKAKIVATDTTHDLALLKSDEIPSDEAHLSSVKQPLAAGNPVIIAGYPGMSWQTGELQVREATITKTSGPKDEAQWLEFSDALSQGNSGGPLLDSTGNVVGVVAAKGRLIHRNDDATEETLSKFDLAISLPVIRDFLTAHDVQFSEADSGIYLSTSHIKEIASRVVVNVQCEISNAR